MSLEKITKVSFLGLSVALLVLLIKMTLIGTSVKI